MKSGYLLVGIVVVFIWRLYVVLRLVEGSPLGTIR